MKFKELSNEELVFIYTLIKDGLNTFDDYLEKGGISYIVDSPMGKLNIFREFTKEELDEILNGRKYKLFNDIISKLDPIIDLISDAEPNLIHEIKEVLEIEEEDDSSEEEDL